MVECNRNRPPWFSIKSKTRKKPYIVQKINSPRKYIFPLYTNIIYKRTVNIPLSKIGTYGSLQHWKDIARFKINRLEIFLTRRYRDVSIIQPWPNIARQTRNIRPPPFRHGFLSGSCREKGRGVETGEVGAAQIHLGRPSFMRYVNMKK